MRKTTAILTIVLLGGFVAVPSAEAGILPGFVMFMWHGVAAPFPPNVNLFIFGAGGAFCGTAVIAGVGPAVNATLAAQFNHGFLMEVPPTFGVWFTAPLGFPVCGPGASGPLLSYWHT